MALFLKNLNIFLLLILLIVFLAPLAVEGNTVTIEPPTRHKSFWDLIDDLIDFIVMLAIAIAPIMFLVAGFYFITAAGDPVKIQTAKRIVLWTFIGLLVVMSAKGLIALFGKIFGVPTPYTPPPPKPEPFPDVWQI